jgi:hypothetical protein
VPFIPARRPTEVLYRPAPVQRQLTKLSENANDEIIEQQKVPIKNTLNPLQNRREERSTQDRTNQRRLSPLKNLPTIVNNKRRPLRFDNEPIHPSPQEQSNVNQVANQDNNKKTLMEVIRRELTEKPLDPNEELIIVEQ